MNLSRELEMGNVETPDMLYRDENINSSTKMQRQLDMESNHPLSDNEQLQKQKLPEDNNESLKDQSRLRNCCREFKQTILLFLQAVVHFIKIYRFNDRYDFLLLLIGIVLSIGTGFGLPLFAVIAGDTIDAFDESAEELASEASENKNLFLIVGFSMAAMGWGAFTAWNILGERVSMKFREQYLKSLIKQEVNCFEGMNVQELSFKFEQNITYVKRAAGLKFGALIYIAASFLIAGKIATEAGFFLSLIMIPTLPVLGVSGFVYSVLVQLKYTKLIHFYSTAQEKAREAMEQIRTVKEFNAENHELQKYDSFLELVRKKVIRYSVYTGIGAGVFALTQYLVYALAFWLGSHCVEGTVTCANDGEDQTYTAGDVILIFFAFFVRLDSMQQLFPSLKAVYNGTVAYEAIYEMISRKPTVSCPLECQRVEEIDFRHMSSRELSRHVKNEAIKLKTKFQSHIQNPEPQQYSVNPNAEGQARKVDTEPNNINSNEDLVNPGHSQSVNIHSNVALGSDLLPRDNILIKFVNVSVKCPFEQDKKVLENVSFTIDKELTGISGRTEEREAILDLILRFVDPCEGQILINGVDIKTFNLCSLRKQIGYLDQKTYLFDTTIRENITMGNIQIEDSAIWATLNLLEVGDAVKQFEEELEFRIGYDGAEIDSRLKKSIVLARLMLKNPEVVLLKEFYSFLTHEQEFNFFQNLEKFKKQKLLIYAGTNDEIMKRTNQIIVIQKGVVHQIGTYSTLPQFKDDKQTDENGVSLKQLFSSPLRQSQAAIRTAKSSKINLRTSEALRSTESHSQKTQVSPQQLHNHEESNLNKYKGKINSILFGNLDRNNFCLYLTGSVLSIISGALYPVFTIFMAIILLETFQFENTSNESGNTRQNINNPILYIIIIGLISFVVNFFETLIFSYIAENICERLRKKVFQKVMKLPIDWFHATPMQSAFRTNKSLTYDPVIVQSLLTNFYSILLKCLSSFVTGLVIAFVFEWRLALLGFAVIPMMMLSGYLSVVFYRGSLNLLEKDYVESTSVISESIANIRSVQCENYSAAVLQRYRHQLMAPLRKAKKRANISSALFGFSQLLIFLSYTIMFFFGAEFFKSFRQISVLDLLTAIFAVIWSGWTSGANFIRLPDKALCRKSASNLFFILDEHDEHDLQIIEKSKLLKQGIEGNIEFKNIQIDFSDKGITLEKISFNVDVKQRAAVFSVPGVGIRPIIDMLYRFKPVIQGSILIDGQDIKNYEISYLRSCLGTISQNPVIFKATLYDNLAYSKSGEVSENQILKACEDSNARKIIEGQQAFNKTERMSINSALASRMSPRRAKFSDMQHNRSEQLDINFEWKGLETFLDVNTVHLSTSQKQRIVIARTLIKKPKIILINDEIANVSYIYEWQIQSAITSIMKHRTSIFMPHYEENLESANIIVVLGREKEKAQIYNGFRELIRDKQTYNKIKREHLIF